MAKVLVVGASGFVGRHLAKALLAGGHAVRCLVRNPARDPAHVADLATAGCEIVNGDMSDLASMQQAFEGIEAAYIAVHTLSPQQSAAQRRFMDIEKDGLRNIARACRMQGGHRLIYVTSLGIAKDSPSEWLRERWQVEQSLLNSGLDVTIIRPGQIVGIGGRGFEMTVRQAKQSIAICFGNGRSTMGAIALADLIYYLVGVLAEPRAYGQCYDVGSDDVLTRDQMIDVVADVLGRRHPPKIHLPLALLAMLAAPIERLGRLPRGAIKGFVDGMKVDSNDDLLPIRAILPRPLLTYREAVAQALRGHLTPE